MRRVAGSSTFSVNRLREDFAPEIVFATRIYEIAGKILLAIGTDSSPHRPIVARTNRSKKSANKDGKPVVTEAIRDGTIYYRYGGQTRPIGYSELSEMLANRERNRIKSMMENLKVVEKIGIQNVGIVDMKQAPPRTSIFPKKQRVVCLSSTAEDSSRKKVRRPTSFWATPTSNQVIHRPLEEEDKNLTTEAAKQIKPILKKIYGFNMPFSPQQVSQILRHLGVLNDNTHSIWEKKLRRRYITRAGIKAAAEFCHSACKIDPPYCLICECYPDGAVGDAMLTDRPRQVAFPVCVTGGAVGGSGPP